MRAILIAALLLGCGGGESSNDPHDVMDCNRNDVGATRCERACVVMTPTTATECSASHPATTVTEQCADTIGVDGTTGCCLIDIGSRVLIFWECE